MLKQFGIIKSAVVAGAMCLMALSGCVHDDSYVIEGTLYGGRNFEDQTIYLVPFAGASADNIDSAIVHDSHFRFSGIATKDDICIIRMRPMMRLFIEELIIVREPGHIYTRLSQTSEAAGTPLNDSLQAWRNFKLHQDSLVKVLKKEVKRATPERAAEIATLQDSIRSVFYKQTQVSASYNSDNAFGEFLNRYVR
ncbi:MAG: DUF4369 domain-containing protein [Marinilabiliaceae bacterium]|nr:DUF4369 domain-containing protein [Bacteroidales bacterium]MDD5815998.1 DUF4369 domain-containing protein [Bacteroidales bacterium]MDY4520399.1 DUF4369 domain-containing protein [Bacteroidales bacterium]